MQWNFQGGIFIFIFGGDLNLNVGDNEVWVSSSHQDPLDSFFRNLFLEENMVDVLLHPLAPNWRNGRYGPSWSLKEWISFLF